MSITTGVFTVNAAFLREIKEDNRRVQELLDAADALFTASPLSDVASVRRLVETLTELRDQLALHFSLEEAYGYFEDAVEAAPRLTERAGALRSQHGPLFVELCGIVEQAERWLYHESSREIRPALARRYERFRQALRQHESQEVALILDAFEGEEGAGD